MTTGRPLKHGEPMRHRSIPYPAWCEPLLEAEAAGKQWSITHLLREIIVEHCEVRRANNE